ncbi:MAG: hypothetical protein QOE11_913 [Solirubrobacteraceae bacterium]|jgi:hypothetical protein|nr:hypothetical protein [Solirubrobacteraceae bacterium]
MIEAEVFGDPVAMRLLAQEIAGRADIVGDAATGFTAALDGAEFEGGAADRLREAAVSERVRLADVAAELRDIATSMYADASAVETQNEDAKAAAAAAQEASQSP